MYRSAFRMKLFDGFEAEYKRRHSNMRNDLKQSLKQACITDYSICLDEETGFLFAYLTIADPQNLKALSRLPVMQEWWQYMKDIMESNEDGSPVVVELKEMFYLQ